MAKVAGPRTANEKCFLEGKQLPRETRPPRRAGTQRSLRAAGHQLPGGEQDRPLGPGHLGRMLRIVPPLHARPRVQGERTASSQPLSAWETLGRERLVSQGLRALGCVGRRLCWGRPRREGLRGRALRWGMFGGFINRPAGAERGLELGSKSPREVRTPVRPLGGDSQPRHQTRGRALGTPALANDSGFS